MTWQFHGGHTSLLSPPSSTYPLRTTHCLYLRNTLSFHTARALKPVILLCEHLSVEHPRLTLPIIAPPLPDVDGLSGKGAGLVVMCPFAYDRYI